MSKSIVTLVLLFVSLAGRTQTTDRLPCVDKRFSIVAHIFLDSLGQPNITEAQLLSNVVETNLAFAPICVSFEICEFRYHPNFEYDIHRRDQEWAELQTLYHQKNCINIYFVEVMDDPSGHCGYAGLGQVSNLLKDGIVIQKTADCCSSGRVLSHELGHYFSLLHTFEATGTELVNGSNCSTAGDQLCDTPADPYTDGAPLGGFIDGNCHFISMLKDANGQYYDPIVCNIMSYYSGCDCGFTHDQLEKMANYYLSNIGMW